MFIHLVLPFTSVNQHPEVRIKIASLILGVVFLWFGLRSFGNPLRYFSAGLTLLISVYLISAVSGASPVSEGVVPKIIFAGCLAMGIAGCRIRGVDRSQSHQQ